MEWLNNLFYNDIQNIPIYLLTLLVAFGVLGVSIFFHELGHLIYLRFKLKQKDAKIRFVYNKLSNFYWQTGEKHHYNTMTNPQYKMVLLFGVLMGTLPILVSAFIWFPFAFLLYPYIVGCWNDLKNMDKAIKEDTK